MDLGRFVNLIEALHGTGMQANVSIHLSVTDPVTPEPVGFFPSPSKQLASPVPGENLNFTPPFWSPVRLLHIQRADRKNQKAF